MGTGHRPIYVVSGRMGAYEDQISWVALAYTEERAAKNYTAVMNEQAKLVWKERPEQRQYESEYIKNLKPGLVDPNFPNALWDCPEYEIQETVLVSKE